VACPSGPVVVIATCGEGELSSRISSLPGWATVVAPGLDEAAQLSWLAQHSGRTGSALPNALWRLALGIRADGAASCGAESGLVSQRRGLQALASSSLYSEYGTPGLLMLAKAYAERRQLHVMEAKCIASLDLDASEDAKSKVRYMLSQVQAKLGDGPTASSKQHPSPPQEGPPNPIAQALGRLFPSSSEAERDSGAEAPVASVAWEPTSASLDPVCLALAVACRCLGEPCQLDGDLNALCDQALRRLEALVALALGEVGAAAVVELLCSMSVATGGILLREMRQMLDCTARPYNRIRERWGNLAALYGAAFLENLEVPAAARQAGGGAANKLLLAIGVRRDERLWLLLLPCLGQLCIRVGESGDADNQRWQLRHPAVATAVHFRYLATPSLDQVCQTRCKWLQSAPPGLIPGMHEVGGEAWWWVPLLMAAAGDIEALVRLLTSFAVLSCCRDRSCLLIWRHYLWYASDGAGPEHEASARAKEWLTFATTLPAPDEGSPSQPACSSDASDAAKDTANSSFRASALLQRAINSEQCPRVAAAGWKALLEAGCLSVPPLVGESPFICLKAMQCGLDTAMPASCSVETGERAWCGGVLPGAAGQSSCAWVVTADGLSVWHMRSKEKLLELDFGAQVSLVAVSPTGGVGAVATEARQHEPSMVRPVQLMPSGTDRTKVRPRIQGLPVGEAACLSVSSDGAWLAVGFKGAKTGTAWNALFTTGTEIVSDGLGRKDGGGSGQRDEHEGGEIAIVSLLVASALVLPASSHNLARN